MTPPEFPRQLLIFRQQFIGTAPAARFSLSNIALTYRQMRGLEQTNAHDLSKHAPSISRHRAPCKSLVSTPARVQTPNQLALSSYISLS